MTNIFIGIREIFTQYNLFGFNAQIIWITILIIAILATKLKNKDKLLAFTIGMGTFIALGGLYTMPFIFMTAVAVILTVLAQIRDD